MKDIQVLVPDIRSSENVGSIFRTADAAGVAAIYLSGFSPTPIDTFGRVNKKIAKTALGAENTLPWKYAKRASTIINRLKKEGYSVVALEQDKRSVPYNKLKTGNKVLIVLGNEVSGLPQNILAKADVIAEIPMRGNKESLNVSVAFGILVYELAQTDRY